MVKENIKAPHIRLPSTDNTEYLLKKSIGNYVIIYFYPKNDTPGCTLETNDFNKLLPNFKKLNCEVYGISKDSLESHLKFKKKYKIKFNLLSDLDKKVLKKYLCFAISLSPVDPLLIRFPAYNFHTTFKTFYGVAFQVSLESFESFTSRFDIIKPTEGNIIMIIIKPPSLYNMNR